MGVLRGSREAGDLQFSMVEGGAGGVAREPGDPPLPGHRTSCSFTTDSEYGAWNLGLELSRQDGVSTIRFIHDLGVTDDPSTIGPGWEYYVQRAIVSTGGRRRRVGQVGRLLPRAGPGLHWRPPD